MNIEYKKADTRAEYTDALRLRVEVFIIEQGCQPGWEPDEEDATAQHYIAIQDNSVIATARARQTAPAE